MDKQRKELIYAAMNNMFYLLPIMHQLNHYRDCDKFLKWLIRNRITGQTLLDWLKINHDNSVMSMVQFIIKNGNKDKEFKPIILNKDWVK